MFWEELLPLPLHSVYLISHCPHTDQILPEMSAPHKSLNWPVLVCFIRCCDVGGFWCIISVDTLDLYFYQRQYFQTDTLNWLLCKFFFKTTVIGKINKHSYSKTVQLLIWEIMYVHLTQHFLLLSNWLSCMVTCLI